MTIQELIEEGRRIQRRTILLVPDGTGDCAAVWYGHQRGHKPEDGHRCWLSVDARCIPSCDIRGWLSIYTNDKTYRGGRVEIGSGPLQADGLRLFAREIVVLPPIDAVIARGSPAIDSWLAQNKWQRTWRYNSNFRDSLMVKQYEAIECQENPLYRKGSYAALGGWHMPWADHDWHELIDERLLVKTYMDSEPWVEAWQMHSGEFEVIQRIS